MRAHIIKRETVAAPAGELATSLVWGPKEQARLFQRIGNVVADLEAASDAIHDAAIHSYKGRTIAYANHIRNLVKRLDALMLEEAKKATL